MSVFFATSGIQEAISVKTMALKALESSVLKQTRGTNTSSFIPS